MGTGAGGGDVTFGSTLTLSSGGNDDLTITAGTGAVTLTGAVALNDNDLTVASSQNSVITAGISGSTGALDITDSGATDINGDLAMSGTGTITLDAASLGADVTTVGGAIDFSGAVTLDRNSGTTTISSGSGGGNITFGGAIEDDSAGDTALYIDAGDADVTFGSTVGVTTAIGALTVLGNDLDLSGGNIEATGDVILVANNPGADAESITFSGRDLDANGGNVFLSADDITLERHCYLQGHRVQLR